MSPKDAWAYYSRAIAYRERGDLDKAIHDLDAAIKLKPNWPLYYEDRGAIWITRGDVGRGIADLSEAIRLNPKDDWVYYGRSNAYRQKGDLDKAVRDLDTAIKLKPNRPLYYEERGATVDHSRRHGAGHRRSSNGRSARSEMTRRHTSRRGPRHPLAPADLQHGEEQVRQMLKDRPAMDRYGEKAGVLHQWAAQVRGRGLAAKSLLESHRTVAA